MAKAFFYIDKEKCINCGLCFLICKKCFSFENNNIKQLKYYSDEDDEIEKLRVANNLCPTRAIYLEIYEEQNIIK